MSELKPKDKGHQVDDLVITCMDFRFFEEIIEKLKDEHGVDYFNIDHLEIGGASKAVVEGLLTTSLEIGFKKHGVKKVWMFDHIDCGGFGGQESYDNDVRKEAEDHFESIDRAQELIHKIMPGIVVVSQVIGLDGKPVQRQSS